MRTIYSMILRLSILTPCLPLLFDFSLFLALYSKPEFRGRVIDAETKQPIEGAVVVVLYEKWQFAGQVAAALGLSMRRKP